jgi:transcriptional regulator with XRE-family HTH domain
MAGVNEQHIVKTIGQRIRDLRKEQDLTQKGLADRLGTSVPSVSKIEAGVTDINLSRLTQIAAALHVEITSLLSDTATPPDPRANIVTVAEKRIANRDEEIAVLQRKIIHLYEELHRK